jgi:hypothetical protein
MPTDNSLNASLGVGISAISTRLRIPILTQYPMVCGKYRPAAFRVLGIGELKT